MKKIVFLLLIQIVFIAVHAQSNGPSYQTAVGLKFYPGAISVKHFVNENNAVEGLANFWNYGSRFTGLYEIHKDISGLNGLQWYVGPGAHLGFWNTTWQTTFPGRQTGLNIGLDGIIGLEYRFADYPISLSADWQPSLNIIGYSYFEPGWGGIGIRYTIR